MICPICGSRDVIASADVDHQVHFCECQNCLHHWSEPYDPASIPKETIKEVKTGNGN